MSIMILPATHTDHSQTGPPKALVGRIANGKSGAVGDVFMKLEKYCNHKRIISYSFGAPISYRARGSLVDNPEEQSLVTLPEVPNV